MTSVAQNMMCTVISEVANLRSSGLLDGFLSMYGAKISTIRPTPGIVTPAIIGWNIVSSSCRPRKYHGAFDGLGVWLMLAVLQQRGVDEDREHEREQQAGERGDELGGQQVRPRVDLVDRLRLDLLDRAALDDGQQALGVPARPGADRHDRRRSGVAWTTDVTRSATATPPAAGARGRRVAAALGLRLGGAAALEEVGGDARSSARQPARTAQPRQVRRRPVRPAAGAAAPSAAAFSRASLARLSRCSGISVMRHPSRCGGRYHNGPLIPPSLRTRQKWIAMKITVMNGKNSTCSTYHRSNVSGPISAPPSKHEAHVLTEHRRVARSCSCRP